MFEKENVESANRAPPFSTFENSQPADDVLECFYTNPVHKKADWINGPACNSPKTCELIDNQLEVCEVIAESAAERSLSNPHVRSGIFKPPKLWSCRASVYTFVVHVGQ